jgi:hypothetical protein
VENAFYQSALSGVSGDNRSNALFVFGEGTLFGIQPKIGFSRAGVGTVAVEAIFRKDR